VVSDLYTCQRNKRGEANLLLQNQSHHRQNHLRSRLLKRNHVQQVTHVQAHGQVDLPVHVPLVILDHLANQGHHHLEIEIEEDPPHQEEATEKKGPNLLKLIACM